MKGLKQRVAFALQQRGPLQRRAAFRLHVGETVMDFQ